MQEMQRFETFTTEIYAALQDPNRYAFAGTHQEAARRTVAQATAILKSPDATPEQRAKAMEILNDAALATGVKY